MASESVLAPPISTIGRRINLQETTLGKVNLAGNSRRHWGHAWKELLPGSETVSLCRFTSVALRALTSPVCRAPAFAAGLMLLLAAFAEAVEPDRRLIDPSITSPMTLRVSYHDFPPYSYTRGDGTADGYAIEVLRAIARDTGLSVTFSRAKNAGESIADIAAGLADIQAHLAMTEEGRDLLDYSTRIDTIALQFYGRADRRQIIEQKQRDGTLRVGFSAGSLSADVVADLNGIVPVAIETNEKLIVALASGEIDVAFFTKRAFLRIVQILGLQQRFFAFSEPNREFSLHFAVSKAAPGVLSILDVGLRNIRAGAEYQRMRDKWFARPQETSATRRVILVSSSILTGIVLLGSAAFLAHRSRGRREMNRLAKLREKEKEDFVTRLQVTNDALRKKNVEMERMLYVISHDLKSPLVSIAGFVRQAQRHIERGNAEGADRSFQRISHNAKEMSALLATISEVGRLDQSPLSIEDLSVNELVADLQITLASDIERAQARLQVTDLPIIRGDETLLKRALQNLVVNAIRHGCPAPNMVIKILADNTRDDEVRVGVRDHGPGVPSDQRQRIFTLYQRLDTATDGQGIGLSVVSKVAELHGGRVWVESEIGSGSTFWIALPRQIEVEFRRHAEAAA